MTEPDDKSAERVDDPVDSSELAEGRPSAGDPETAAAEDGYWATFRRLGPAGWLAAAWFTLPIAGMVLLVRYMGDVSAWLQSQGSMAEPLYAGLFTVLAGLGIMPTWPQAALGGWAFGTVLGTVLALVGFTGASVIGYAIARTVGRQSVEKELGRNAKARAVRDALVASGPFKTLGIVMLIRFPPNSPFSFTSFLLATTGVPLWSFVLGTAVGMLPRTALVVWVGHQVQGQFSADAAKDAQPDWVFWTGIAVAVAVALILIKIGNRAIEKLTAEP